MADWSVKIAVVNGKTVFQAQLQPGNTSTLYMSPGDSVSWNNTTPNERQPTLTEVDGKPVTPGDRGSALYLSDPIAAGHSSRPSWIAPKTTSSSTYSYINMGHADETGTIIVANPPAPTS